METSTWKKSHYTIVLLKNTSPGTNLKVSRVDRTSQSFLNFINIRAPREFRCETCQPQKLVFVYNKKVFHITTSLTIHVSPWLMKLLTHISEIHQWLMLICLIRKKTVLFKNSKKYKHFLICRWNYSRGISVFYNCYFINFMLFELQLGLKTRHTIHITMR